MRNRITAVVAVALILMSIVACTPKGADIPGDIGEDGLSADDAATLMGYISGFGHVRVLGDIDHVLKGEKVDDEEGVTVQSMTAGAVAFNDTKTELAIPLTLKDYDFDGHRNPEDPSPEKYTRIATGNLTLVLTGAVNEDGTVFNAAGYRIEDADITLAVDDSEYIWLDLPEMNVEADELSGIFIKIGGIAKASVAVLLQDGKPAGITDVNTPKFGELSGTISVNGKALEL